MNFYKRHLGDYAKDTKQLTMLEHGAYTLLLDHYYATEKPLPISLNRIYKICGATHVRHYKAINRVLSFHFVRTKHGYLNKRADEEIENAKTRINTARNNGLKGGRPTKKNNPLGFPTKPIGLSPETQWGSYPDSTIQTPESSSLTSSQDTKTLLSHTSPPNGGPVRELDGFDAFWDLYPVQQSKIKARYAWIKQGCARHAAEIIAALVDWKGSPRWSNPRYVPHAHTFLDEGRWKENPHPGPKKPSFNEQLAELYAREKHGTGRPS